jgi:hypothetical protein
MKQQLPDKEEIRYLIDELHAELTSDDRQTAQEAARLCRALSLRAAERLGLIVTGIQPATVPQVAMSSIAILKGLAWWEKVMPGLRPKPRSKVHGSPRGMVRASQAVSSPRHLA